MTAMAKQAQYVIGKAAQLHGGDGVRHGHIYEGAFEVRQVVIARQLLSGA